MHSTDATREASEYDGKAMPKILSKERKGKKAQRQQK